MSTTIEEMNVNDNYDHAMLNRVAYTPEQIARIESERPHDGVPIKTASGFELAAYRETNGAKFVTLVDGSEETWEAYCEETRQAVKYRKGNAAHRAVA